ncbi:hypothetical protein BDR22DRAFT_964818 [Usnea florida]
MGREKSKACPEARRKGRYKAEASVIDAAKSNSKWIPIVPKSSISPRNTGCRCVNREFFNRSTWIRKVKVLDPCQCATFSGCSLGIVTPPRQVGTPISLSNASRGQNPLQYLRDFLSIHLRSAERFERATIVSGPKTCEKTPVPTKEITANNRLPNSLLNANPAVQHGRWMIVEHLGTLVVALKIGGSSAPASACNSPYHYRPPSQQTTGFSSPPASGTSSAISGSGAATPDGPPLGRLCRVQGVPRGDSDVCERETGLIRQRENLAALTRTLHLRAASGSVRAPTRMSLRLFNPRSTKTIPAPRNHRAATDRHKKHRREGTSAEDTGVHGSNNANTLPLPPKAAIMKLVSITTIILGMEWYLDTLKPTARDRWPRPAEPRERGSIEH